MSAAHSRARDVQSDGARQSAAACPPSESRNRPPGQQSFRAPPRTFAARPQVPAGPSWVGGCSERQNKSIHDSDTQASPTGLHSRCGALIPPMERSGRFFSSSQDSRGLALDLPRRWLYHHCWLYHHPATQMIMSGIVASQLHQAGACWSRTRQHARPLRACSPWYARAACAHIAHE